MKGLKFASFWFVIVKDIDMSVVSCFISFVTSIL